MERAQSAVRAALGGLTFNSPAEARRYAELKSAEQAGFIHDLELQPAYPCVVNGVLVCTYRADFRYRTKDGKEVVEDVKGNKLQVVKLKKRLVSALYPGTKISEVRS